MSLDTLEAVPEDIVDESSDEDAAELRRRILYLSETTREVLIRHYFNGYSIADIAKQIGIPAGTVKSRLSAGREKIKEGWMKPMPEKKTCIPGFLNVSYSGSDGANHEPTSLVEGDRIAQNLLITAYDRPLSVAELAAAVSIPTVYVEPIVRRLVDGELMAAAGGKVYTDFVIFKPEDFLSRFDAQLAFVHERFNRFWSVLADVLAEIGASDFGGRCPSVRSASWSGMRFCAPCRAFSSAFSNCLLRPPAGTAEAGSRWAERSPAAMTTVPTAARTNMPCRGATGSAADASVKCVCSSASSTRRCGTIRRDGLEAAGSTCISGKCRRFCGVFYRGVPVEKARISSTMLESIDRLIDRTGLLAREDGVLRVDIPVLSRADYTALERIIVRGRDRLKAGLGTEYRAFLKGQQIGLPGHLRSVPPYCRFLPPTEYLVMAVLREAYEKRLHLADVDYCCPPVVLVCDEI